MKICHPRKHMDDEVGEVAGRGTDNHPADMATITFDRELDEGLEEGAQQTLEQINRPSLKLDDGTFGTCERCGKPIGEERLRHDLGATPGIDDQRLADRDRGMRRPTWTGLRPPAAATGLVGADARREDAHDRSPLPDAWARRRTRCAGL